MIPVPSFLETPVSETPRVSVFVQRMRTSSPSSLSTSQVIGTTCRLTLVTGSTAMMSSHDRDSFTDFTEVLRSPGCRSRLPGSTLHGAQANDPDRPRSVRQRGLLLDSGRQESAGWSRADPRTRLQAQKGDVKNWPRRGSAPQCPGRARQGGLKLDPVLGVKPY